MSIIGMKTIDGQNMGILKVQNHSIQIVNNSTGDTVYEDSNYTAFQVHATNEIIPANEIYAVDVPAGMIESFRLRTDDDITDTDIIVQWGDGTTTNAKDLPQESIDRKDQYTDEQYIFTFTHEYTTPGKYIVKITGKKYWGFQHNNANNIVSRILDSDLPLAQNVQNIAGLCSGGNYKLVSVHVPTGQQLFTNIHNASSCFANCHNLKQATNFETKFRFTRTVANFFQNCQNLIYTDFQLPVLCIYANAGMNGVYRGCTRLGQQYTDPRNNNTVQTKIQDLFPPQGFVSRAISMTYCFYGCSSLTGNVPASFLWRDLRINWTVTNCFTGASAAIRSQVPASWGGAGEEYVPDEIVMPVASTVTLGAVKPDGVTITADANGVITAVNSGNGGGSGLLSENNILLDNKSIAVGTDNIVGGYGVKITKYYASNNTGQSYLQIASCGNEAEGFENNSGIDNPTNGDATSIDWTLLPTNGSIRVHGDPLSYQYISATIASRNVDSSRIYLTNKLSYTPSNSSTATDVSEQDILGGLVSATFPNKDSADFAMTIGVENVSVGIDGFALGTFNFNGGIGSFISGANNSNTGDFANVLGFGNKNSGGTAVIIGSTNKAQDSGVLLGYGNELYNSASSLIGQNSIAIGGYNKMYSNSGMNIGTSHESRGLYCTNIGYRNKTYGKNGISIGSMINNNWQGNIMIGNRGTINPQITYDGNDENIYKSYKNAFVVCCGSSDPTEQSIAFEITNQYYYCNPSYTGQSNSQQYIYVDAKLFEVNSEFVFKCGTIEANRTILNKTSITATANTNIDLITGSYFYLTVSSATSLTMSNAVDGHEFKLVIDGDINNVTFDGSLVIANALTSSGNKKYVYKGFVVGTSIILEGIGVLS